MISRTDNDAQINQSLYALVNSSTGNATFCCDIFKWDASILRYNFKDLSVKTVYFLNNILILVLSICKQI